MVRMEVSGFGRGFQYIRWWQNKHMKRLIVALVIVTGVTGVTAFSAAPGAQTARLSKMFDAPALLNDLKTLSADDMNGRAVGSPESAKARAYLISRFTSVGLKPIGGSFEHAFKFTSGGRNTTPVEREGVNIIGEIKGKKMPATYLVITAHYDHLAPRNGVIMNGADDNASGAAALVAVAQYFAKNRPEHSVIIVACDAEEVGLRGSVCRSTAGAGRVAHRQHQSRHDRPRS
jgi:hypothetical protein